MIFFYHLDDKDQFGTILKGLYDSFGRNRLILWSDPTVDRSDPGGSLS
jgi:hypothetical protein